MPVLIQSVTDRSPAALAGIKAGDTLLSIDHNAIQDVLDYRFYMTSTTLSLSLLRGGKPYTAAIAKEEYQDLGLEFETYLMDRQLSCKNKCVFCFVDQMPPGMRKTLYFKDDDSRMSFLFGNYITMTNLKDEDIDRIIRMHISPVNVSVHTTDPELRVQMMKNPAAAPSLRYLRRLCDAGIRVNTQLVLVPGCNDGKALERTLRDLGELLPNLQSIACVPVGLTRYRDGLPKLRPFTKEEALDTVSTIHRFADGLEKSYGERVAYPSDEFFLRAELDIPASDYYGEFDQLENGVGLIALLRDDFARAADDDLSRNANADLSVITGAAAFPLLQALAAQVMEKQPGVRVSVYPVINRFFGETITVAGLVTGQDILEQAAGKPLGQRVLIPSVMLRHEGDRLLDDMTLEELAQGLGVPVLPVNNDGWELYDAMTGRKSPACCVEERHG